MSEPTPVVLLVTAGRTDLKFLTTREDGRRELADVGSRSCRAVHRWLLENPDRWAVVAPDEGQRFDFDAKDEAERKLPFVDYEAKATEDLPLRLAKPDVCLLEQAGRLQLVAPKLSAIMHHLMASAQAGKIRLAGGLVLYTHREGHRKSEEEPIAIGEILARWLAGHSGLPTVELPEANPAVLAQGTMGYYSFLRGKEDWEAPDGNLNPDMKVRLETALRAISRWEGRPWLMAAAVGGFPEVKSYLAALAEVHFQDRWRPLKHPEQASEPLVPEPGAGARYAGDTEAAQARANALRLLRRWDIHGAYAAAAHLREARGGVWGTVLLRLDEFRAGLGIRKAKDDEFDGALSRLFENPLAWKTKQPGHDGRWVERNAMLRLIVSGFRAESSLREGRIVDALNWTYTFYNAMVWDLVEYLARTQFCKDKGVQFVKIVGRDMEFSGGNPSIHHGTKIKPDDKDFWFNETRFRKNTESRFVLVEDDFPMNRPKLAFPQIANLLNDYGNWESAFVKIAQCKYLRNINTHNVLSPEEVNKVRKELCDEGVWQNAGTHLTITGTPAAQGCLATFYGEGQGDQLRQRIEAVHAAAAAALLRGE